MSLKEKIMKDMKDAMRAKNTITLSTLRAIKAAILLYETDKDAKPLDEAGEMKLLQKLHKQRKESAEIYKQQNREELEAQEIAEAEVIEKYLPEMMSDDDLYAAVQEIIQEVGASGMQDMGKVMGIANKKLAGKAAGKAIAENVKKILSAK
ncbi:MAG: GatB/YqeY domain-containing protein [Bacteroidota bacterium]|nr:GatB/YqeY domain-containing protein [Bacteroidota bacterium]